jgi:hypothetical protein
MFHGIHVLTSARRIIPLLFPMCKGNEYVNIGYITAIHYYTLLVTFGSEMIQKSFFMLHCLFPEHFLRQFVKQTEE